MLMHKAWHALVLRISTIIISLGDPGAKLTHDVAATAVVTPCRPVNWSKVAVVEGQGCLKPC